MSNLKNLNDLNIRPAAVANLFYPGNAGELSAFISSALEHASAELAEHFAIPKAIIVPHAGYIYSGPTAAFAYQLIKDAAIDRVVLFGPAHRVGFDGMAVPEAEAYATPLGTIPIDREAVAMALKNPEVQQSDHPHAQEHALEVQLPFLQRVLGDFTLLPVCIGRVQPQCVAELMRPFLNEPGTLIVVSSDLSHFHAYDEACVLDKKSVAMILELQGCLSHDQACGATGINALISVAGHNGLQPRLLDYRNSGDTASDKQRVVGYASVGFFTDGGVH